MSDIVYVTGHKNPDSDSICGAIAYAYLKQQMGENAKPCRLGKLNNETKYILKKFGFEQPELITSAKAALKEIAMDEAVTVSPDTNLRKIWDLFFEKETKTVYVIDENEKMIGLTTVADVSQIQMQDLNQTSEILKDTPLKNFLEVLKASVVCEGKHELSGFVRIADKKMMERDLTGAIMVLSSNEDEMIKCIFKGCGMICLSENYIPNDYIVQVAKDYGVTIITTPYNMMKILQMIYRAIPVRLMMTPAKDGIGFNGNEYAEDVAKIMLKTRYRSYPVFMNDKLFGSVTRFHLLTYKPKQFILIDHNETSQTVDDIQYGEILEIIDHHRIGDIETNQPICFRNQRVGSSCTIITNLFRERNVEIPYEIAGLLLGAIISDTMNFHSPTCTDVDINVANQLATEHNIDLKELATEIYQATANLDGCSFKDILYTDFKEYELDGSHIAIGQRIIFDLDEIDTIKKDMKTFIEGECDRYKYDLLMMAFSNVAGDGSKFIYTGKLAPAIESVFKTDASFVEGLVSRKKQMLPQIARLIK